MGIIIKININHKMKAIFVVAVIIAAVLAKKPSNEPASPPTLFNFMNCKTTTCAGLACAGGDTACTLQAYNYAVCSQSNSNCLAWLTDYSNLSSNDPLTDNYYLCDLACRPTRAASAAYWKIYSCQAGCADVVFNTTA